MSIDPSTAPEVPAWVKDSDGNYYRIGGGGAAPTVEPEVIAQATEPAPGTADLFWADTSAPVASTVVEPYVKVSGDTMAGPLVLSGAPTLLTQAGRWADGVPRFADAAARDAAYLTIGGPASGMKCWLLDLQQEQTYFTAGWAATGGLLPYAYLVLPSVNNLPLGWSMLPASTFIDSTQSSAFTITADGGILYNIAGLYDISFVGCISSPSATIALGMLSNGNSATVAPAPGANSIRLASTSGTDLRGTISYTAKITVGTKTYLWIYTNPVGLTAYGEMFFRYLGPI